MVFMLRIRWVIGVLRSLRDRGGVDVVLALGVAGVDVGG